MKNFDYVRASDLHSVLVQLVQSPGSKVIGGGTNLVDLMREHIEEPDALIDLAPLPLAGIRELSDGGILIGATATNTAVAGHHLVRDRYPLVSQATLCGASGQIRNMATVGGNLLQRTRCAYFYDKASACNKRDPGSGCDALLGFNRMHAIFGASPSCVATHPSDLCVALAALDAVVHVESLQGPRAIPFQEFHRLPGDTPHVDTTLGAGELITGVELPPLAFARRSAYRKVRDRSSYAFALVSVAAAVEVSDNRIVDVRVALGGVAHRPWRALRLEDALRGCEPSAAAFERAAAAELADARGLTHNSFKIELARRTLASVLRALTGSAWQGKR